MVQETCQNHWPTPFYNLAYLDEEMGHFIQRNHRVGAHKTYLKHALLITIFRGMYQTYIDQFSVRTNISTILPGTHRHRFCLNFQHNILPPY